MRSLNIWQMLLLWLVLSMIAIVIMRIVSPVSLKKGGWQPQPAPSMTGVFTKNNALKNITIEQPYLGSIDTVEVDVFGRRFASLGSGKIMHWQKGGKAKLFVQLNGTPTGLAADKFGNLYVATQESGKVLKINEQKKVTSFKNKYKNTFIANLNDVAVASSGEVFATRSTEKRGMEKANKAVIAHENDGVIYYWKNEKAVPQVLAAGLAFPNGIILAHDEQSVLFAETTEYKVSRIWLTGANAGKKEVLLENLPGFAGDLVADNDGKHYWLTVYELRKNMPALDKITASALLRALIINLPINWLPKPKGTPFVVKFDGDGNIVQTLQANDERLPGFSSITKDDTGLIFSTIDSISHSDVQHPIYRVALPKEQPKELPKNKQLE